MGVAGDASSGWTEGSSTAGTSSTQHMQGTRDNGSDLLADDPQVSHATMGDCGE